MSSKVNYNIPMQELQEFPNLPIENINIHTLPIEAVFRFQEIF